MRKVEFFKGDRELSLWFIPITLIWFFVVIGEGGRILTSPDPVTVFLSVFPTLVFIAILSYLAFRYLSRWLAFILLPLCAAAELIWWGGDIAGASAQRGVSPQLVVVLWVVEGLCLIPPYFITKYGKTIIKQLKNVHVMLIVGGILIFLVGLYGPGPILSLFLSPLLIASGVAYWLYKRRYRKRKK